MRSDPSWAASAFSNCPHLCLLNNTKTSRCVSRDAIWVSPNQVAGIAAWSNPAVTACSVPDTNSVMEENHRHSLKLSALHRLRHWKSLSRLVIIDKCISEFRGLGAMYTQKTLGYSHLPERCVSLKPQISGLAALFLSASLFSLSPTVQELTGKCPAPLLLVLICVLWKEFDMFSTMLKHIEHTWQD